jgi:hypothetical protein
MPEPHYHLVKHFAKPEPGEFVPKSIYITPDMPDVGELKRVREVNVLRVVNQLSGSISTIELTDEEKEQFEDVYKAYQEKGGQILFSRKKVGRKTVSFLNSQRKKRKKTERKKPR